MKKILMFLCIFCIFQTPIYALYSPTTNDELIISALTNRINTIIDKKGEKNRATFVKKLTDVKSKIKNSEKYTYIIDKVIKNVTPSMNDIPSSLSDYLKEIDPITPTSTGTVSPTNAQAVSSSIFPQLSTNWLDLEEYVFSRENIYAEISTSTQSFSVGCQNFSEKWNNFYFKELEIYKKGAEKTNNTLLLQLLKTDFTGFEKYYKEKCKTELKSITEKISIKTNIYDELSVKKVYYQFKKNYIEYLENLSQATLNGTPGIKEYCMDISNIWNYFDFPRLKMLKQVLTNDGKKDMLELFEDIETKTRKVYKDYCKNTNELAN